MIQKIIYYMKSLYLHSFLPVVLLIPYAFYIINKIINLNCRIFAWLPFDT